MSRIVIIGAGIAGLSAGYHARQRGLDYAVFERHGHVGGLCASKTTDGFTFDYSGHLLHLKDPYAQSTVRELLGGNLKKLLRKAFIFSHGVHIPYPFQANLRTLPPRARKECLLGFVRAYYEKEDLPTSSFLTFHDWIMAKLGAGIGQHFMFPYNQKVWTISPKDMTCDWLSEFVPKPSLDEVFEGAFLEQKKAFGYNAEFLYPRRGGIQSLASALAQRTPKLELNEKLVCIRLGDKCAIFESGREIRYEKLISTLPLKSLLKCIDGEIPSNVALAGERLRHNSVLILNLGVRGENLTDRHWIYIPEKKFRPYRVGVYTNFSKSMAPPGMTSYYAEIAYQKKWKIDKGRIKNKAIDDLIEMKFIPKRKDIVIDDVMDIDCAYVIFDHEYAGSRRMILDYLGKKDVLSIGRYGNWEYSGMEESFKQGKTAVEGLEGSNENSDRRK